MKNRSPPFPTYIRRNKMVYFIYVNGLKVPVSREVYREYWKLTNRENYLDWLEVQHHVRPFSNYTDCQLTGVMADEKMVIQKIIETKEILQLLCEALLTLNDDEFKHVKDLFFEDNDTSNRLGCYRKKIVVETPMSSDITNHSHWDQLRVTCY